MFGIIDVNLRAKTIIFLEENTEAKSSRPWVTQWVLLKYQKHM